MKKALIISLSLHIITIAVFGFKRYYYSQRPVAEAPAEWSVTWNALKNDLFSVAPIDSGDVVFLGDSHVERFLLNDFYPGKRMRNRGIGSNTTTQVINRLPDILKRKPSKLFLLIGINDLAMRRPVDSVYNNIVRIAEEAKAAGAIPHIISLFPSRGNDADLNDETVKLNEMLTSYCNKNKVQYIDMFTSLEKGHELNKDLTSDDTHLNSAGYVIWKEVMGQYIDN